jgi:hypothetical protein
MTTVFRRFIFLFVSALSLTSAMSGVVAEGAVSTTEQQLLEKFAPTLASPEQKTACGSGEPYIPMSVEAILNNADVLLKTSSGTLITTAPSAADLFSAGPDAHLDFPGNALSPGCDYENWLRSMNTSPAIYGRIATDPEYDNNIAVQYWFYWPFNDWNNRHESDWEMMQINFGTASVEEALTIEPTSVILAQHEGGEIQDWDDISLRDDRPLVFPAAGSHATYFSANRWVGTSAQTGVGCDDTRTPARVLSPQVIALPRDIPTSATDPFAWLAFTGHWGEQHAGFNNGPTGPTSKMQWENPLVWSDEEGRAGSIALPPIGAPAADFFCGASERFSMLLLDFLDHPLRVMLAIAVVVGAIVLAVRRTRWTPSTPLPIRQQRRNGMIWTSSVKYVWLRKKWIIPFIAVLIMGGLLAQWLRQIVFRATSTGDLSDPLSPNINTVGGLSYGVWLLILLPTVAFTIAGITRLMQFDLAESTPNNNALSVSQATRDAISPKRFFPSLFFTVFVFAIALFQVVLFWFTPRWILAPAFAPETHPFKQAAELTRGHRRHIIVISFLTISAATAIGPLIGAVLLLATNYSLSTISIVTATINAVLVVWGVIALNYLHADLRLRHQPESTINALS